MRLRTLAAAGTVAAGMALAVAPVSPAHAVCDSYSGGCPSPPGEGLGNEQLSGNEQEPGSQGGSEDSGLSGGSDQRSSSGGGGSAVQPDTLPFTGGELVLMTAVGVGAVAGGTALVVAGRRKKAPAA